MIRLKCNRSKGGEKVKNTIILILSLLVIGLGSYVIFDKVINKDKAPSHNDSNEEINIKLDSSKDYVYDAEYSYESKYDVKNYKSQDVTWSTNNLLENKTNIKVPYFNFNTDDATQVNNKMLQLFNEKMKAVESYLACSEVICQGIFLNYKVYNNDQYVSVIVVTGTYATDVPLSTYYGYVFSKKTGKLLTINDIANEKGMTISELEEKTKTAIEKYYADTIKDDPEEAEYIAELKPKTYNDLSVNINNQGTTGENEKGIIYFFNENKGLNVLVNIYLPAGRGIFTKLLEL